MTFFNTKEEVVEIQLTPYGKHLLSKGQFAPQYYEFYDDDIIYDSQYGGVTESQEQIQNRINSTKRTKTQYAFAGADTRYKEYMKSVSQGGDIGELFLEKRRNFSFPILPLGNNSATSQNVPSSTLRFRNIEISSSYATNLNSVPTSIRTVELYPQEMTLKLRQKTDDEPPYTPVILEEEDASFYVKNFETMRNVDEVILQNNQRVEVAHEVPYILIDISESEIELSNDNYEMYLYELEEDENGEEVEKQLFFLKEQRRVVDNVLLDDDDVIFENPEINEAYVNYHFSVLTDREIPPNILCNHLTDEEIQKLVQVDGYDIDCRAIRILQRLQNPEMFTDEEDLRDLEGC